MILELQCTMKLDLSASGTGEKGKACRAGRDDSGHSVTVEKICCPEFSPLMQRQAGDTASLAMTISPIEVENGDVSSSDDSGGNLEHKDLVRYHPYARHIAWLQKVK